eukprot:TRINITY_DN19542_c0_g1_i1.p1 TRINITY_DN19542_c0_g1~~TRINITY_DN19542_c0_g1_i1.p1  ORF type:complete len:239 (+),score=34.93 TRINITY_DN19542_c0_g1_i1:109-825(+)
MGAGITNELWAYDMGASRWAMISGTTALGQAGSYGTADPYPGSRTLASLAADGSRLVLFGGYGLGNNSVIGYLNDVWVFEPADASWSWLAGSAHINAVGRYVGPVCQHHPGGRQSANAAILSGRRLLVCGGMTSPNGQPEQWYLNDVWLLDLSDAKKCWTFVSGDVCPHSVKLNQPGIYHGAHVCPGARSYAAHAVVNNGDGFLWFGGYGFGADRSMPGFLADLWFFDAATSTWSLRS